MVFLAGAEDAGVVAQLLHDFNVEFDTPSPGPGVLEGRLRTLLVGPSTFCLCVGAPVAGFALVTLRPNVWYDGPVALLDELYVHPTWRGQGLGSELIDALLTECRDRAVGLIEINVDEGDTDAQRFYERHGFLPHEPGGGERAQYWWRELETEPGA